MSCDYSLGDVYGDEFGDLIAEIPDPTLLPLQIIADFLAILSDLGVWCADRAALLFMIKIDKLKTREKYERHFLLLSVLFSVMVSVHMYCTEPPICVHLYFTEAPHCVHLYCTEPVFNLLLSGEDQEDV